MISDDNNIFEDNDEDPLRKYVLSLCFWIFVRFIFPLLLFLIILYVSPLLYKLVN